jgi:hypothetical protein
MPRGRPREYQVAVPSFRRADSLSARALPWLLGSGVRPSRITVFTHDHDEQLDAYRALTTSAGVELVTTDRRGITAQREAIIGAYPPGTPLVCVDDDVTGIEEALDKKRLRPVADVDALFTTMFTECFARDLWVWGLAPVVNAFYLTPGRLSEGLKFLIFTVFGCFTRPGHPVHRFTVPYKDEHELSLRAWWWDGAVLRHDGMAARANFYTLPGGCQGQRTPAAVAESVASLRQQWPGLIRLNTRKRDTGYTEITLAAKPRHGGHPATVGPPGQRRSA